VPRQAARRPGGNFRGRCPLVRSLGAAARPPAAPGPRRRGPCRRAGSAGRPPRVRLAL